MPINDFEALMRENSYPGRGLALGCTGDGQNAVVVYFIMGRSENSRNRVFTEKDGGIVTEAADRTKKQDPGLVIYAPVRRYGNSIIVSNGDQTETICTCLARGIGFQEALRTRAFEPDAPHFTPRISGILSVSTKQISYGISILKTADGNPASVQRMFFEYTQPLPGEGHYIHTYARDGNPLPSFTGEPKSVAFGGSIDEMGAALWGALNDANKVALFVRYIGLNGDVETRIYNKYPKS